MESVYIRGKSNKYLFMQFLFEKKIKIFRAANKNLITLKHL